MEVDYRDTRREYLSGKLDREDLDPDTFKQFAIWMDFAKSYPVSDATAAALATASSAGRPSVRIVLLKHFDEQGFCWYTDKRSQKGAELAENPWAELAFFWRDLDWQVRISGKVEPLPDTLNDAYFFERPPGSQYAAAASVQSSVVATRDELEARAAEVKFRYPEENVPRPDGWGGYRLIPDHFEFWQGRQSRLHDRFQYELKGDSWTIDRLCP